MKKREFQKNAAAALFKRIAAVNAELGENPNITVRSRNYSSYFNLRSGYNLLQVSVKQTGELSYQLTDMLGNTEGRKTYHEYREGDDFERIIGKFADDFGRMYKDLLQAGTLYGFCHISLSYGADTDAELEEYEYYTGLENRT